MNESSLSEHGVLLADGEAPEEREDTRKEQEEALSPTEQSSAVEALSSFEEQEPKGASARTLPPLSARTSSTKDPSTASRPPTATVNNSTSRSGSSPTKAEGKSAVAVRSEEKPRLLPKPESVKSPKKTEAKEVKDAAAPKIEAAQRNVTQQPESDEKPAASAPVDTQEAHPPAAAIVAPSDAENAEPPANQTTGVDLDEIDANGIFVKRKGEWDSRIEEDKHANDKPEPRSDAPKQKVTRVVWKVPVKDAANNNGQPPVYRSRRWDGIDVALGNILNEYYQNHPASPWRFHAIAANAGEYVMYNRDSAQKRVVFVRFVQRKLFIRYSQGPSGPEWVMFADAVKRLDEMFAKQQQDPAY